MNTEEKEYSHESPEYKAYISSPEWQLKRKEAIAYHGEACKSCHKVPRNKSVDIHHLSYTNFTNENVKTELVPLCRTCHTAVHRQFKLNNSLNKTLRDFTNEYIATRNASTGTNGYTVIELPTYHGLGQKTGSSKKYNRSVKTNFTKTELASFSNHFLGSNHPVLQTYLDIASSFQEDEQRAYFSVRKKGANDRAKVFEIWEGPDDGPFKIKSSAIQKILEFINSSNYDPTVKPTFIAKSTFAGYNKNKVKPAGKITREQVSRYVQTQNYKDATLVSILECLIKNMDEKNSNTYISWNQISKQTRIPLASLYACLRRHSKEFSQIWDGYAKRIFKDPVYKKHYCLSKRMKQIL